MTDSGSLQGPGVASAHPRTLDLTEVLPGVEEYQQDDDRPRPDRVAVVPPPEDRVQNDETRRDDQTRHGQLEEQPPAANGSPSNASSDSVMG